MSRRKLPTGVYKRTWPSGTVTYQAKWHDASGKRHTATFDTARDAADYREQMQRQRRTGGTGDPTGGRIPLAEWWPLWMSGRTVRPSTLARDQSLGDTHVLTEFGAWPIADIRAADIRVWIQRLGKEPLAPATVKECLRVLSTCLTAAVADERILANPAAKVKPPPNPHREARFLTLAELADVEDAMPQWWRPLVPFLADTGLRIGEAAALTVGDIDYEHGTVHITKALVEVPKAASGQEQSLIRSYPKTSAGRRVVPTLTDQSAAILTRMVADRRLTRDDLLFTGTRGGPLRPNTWRRRVWRPAVRTADVSEPLPTPHSLRHTAVAAWIAAGVSAPMLAKFAGHGSDQTIQQLYGHLMRTDTTELRAQLQAMRHAGREDARSRRAGQDVVEFPSNANQQSS